jgi:aminoglycoside 2''-phosphotransferase
MKQQLSGDIFLEKINQYIDQICRFYPHFQVSSARIDWGGQYNDVVILNEEWVFRFPKYEESIRTLEAEHALLEAIQEYVTLSIPDPAMHSQGTYVVGEVFSGYRMIDGSPLYRELYTEIPDETLKDRIVAQIAGFLSELHAIPRRALPEQLPEGDSLDEWRKMYTDIRQLLFPYMRADARQHITDHFESFLDEPSLQDSHTCLRHGDFGPTNILYDSNKGLVSGIIDFSSAAWGDPAADIASVSTYGEDFFQRLKTRYALTEAMQARSRFYRGTFALQEALHGIRNGDKEAFESGMAAYL